MVGACCAAARSSSSATRSERVALPGPGEVLGQAHQRGQRLPAVPDRPGPGRGLRPPPLGAEHRPHLGRQIHRVVEQRVVAAGPGGSAQRDAGLPHLGPFEEPLGAAQLVGHPRVGQRLFVHLGLGVDPVQHGDLGRGDARCDEIPDPARGALGLGWLVPVLLVDGIGPRGALRDQLQAVLGGAAAGLGQQPVGQVDDLRGRAVVPDQLDHRGLRMADPEVEQVVGGGAGEGVDRLAGVAHDAEVLPVPHPQFEEPLLQRADVLVLVDHEVLVLTADPVGDVVPVLEDADGQQQHVLEVDHSAVALELLVHRVDLGDLGRAPGCLAGRLRDDRRIVGGHGLGDLGPLDLARHVPQLVAVEPDTAARRGLGDQLDLALDEPGHLAADRLGPEELELAQRRRVERTRLDTARAELAQPPAHLAGRAVGESDGEHRGRLQDPGAHPVGDAVRDRARLARTGSGQHAHRTAQGRRDLALLGVETVEHRVGGVRNLREERGVRCCCHPAMLPGPTGPAGPLSTGARSQSY